MPIAYENASKYKELIEKIAQKKCVLFVGSGLSVGAGYPDWYGLMLKMIEKAKDSAPVEDLKDLQSSLEKGDYLQIASYFREQVSSQEYHNFLLSIFASDEKRPTENHLRIVRLPLPFIVTTNYDKLIESAYYEVHKLMAPVRHHKSADLGTLIASDKFFIFKSHGIIDNLETIILTRNDYNQLIYDNQAYRKFIETLFLTKTLLFLGFSLNDPDFNLFSEYLAYIFKGKMPRSYALLTGVSNLQMRTLERERNIKVIFYDNPDGKHLQVGEFLDILSRQLVKAPAEKPSKSTKIPFKFLEPYYQTDEKYYWGRQKDTALKNIYETIADAKAKLIVIFGQKGVGKTSAINALIKPLLKRDGFNVEYFSYSDIPNLMEVVTAATCLSRNKSKKSAIFFDHFDKLMDHEESKNGFEDLQKWLLSFIDNLEEHQHLVVVIQEDRAASLWKLFQTIREQHPNFPENKIIEIEPMDSEQKQEFITQAAKSVNLEFNETILTTLLEQNSDLTYLQAMCYYLVKNGLQANPAGLKELTLQNILYMLIQDADIMSKLENLNSPDLRRGVRAILEVLLEKKEEAFIRLLNEMSPRLKNFGIVFPYSNE